MKTLEQLAREAGMVVVATLDCDPPYNTWSAEDASLARFRAACRAEALEEAARIVETQDTYGDSVGCWFETLAAKIRAAAIREMK